MGVWLGLSLGLVLQAASSILGPQSLWGVACLAIPVLATIAWNRQIPRRVDLYQNGIDYRIGRRHHYVFWSQVVEIYQTPLYALHRPHRPTGAPDSWMYRLVRRDGRSVRLYNLESIRSLGLRVQQQVLRRHLPVALDAFHSGYTIRFGRRLAISLDGIRLSGKSLSWYEITEITIDEADDFQVTERRRPPARRRLAIRHVPNLLLLDQILLASQRAVGADPLDIAPHRGAIFDEPSTSASGEPSGFSQLLPGSDTRDEPDDSSGSQHRPRQPK
jgi:hypothetical protein